uniref:Thionin-like protein 2 n=2 Tax=Nicotiana TaxID=4085 RepID=A0A1S3YA50_TOBAC|nr:PREDICTED: uncharacterized protein LOC107774040 [Nicotiana tabacum]
MEGKLGVKSLFVLAILVFSGQPVSSESVWDCLVRTGGIVYATQCILTLTGCMAKCALFADCPSMECFYLSSASIAADKSGACNYECASGKCMNYILLNDKEKFGICMAICQSNYCSAKASV